MQEMCYGREPQLVQLVTLLTPEVVWISPFVLYHLVASQDKPQCECEQKGHVY